MVTGAGGGIGRGIVDRFIREGARVCAVDVDKDRLAPLADLHGAAVCTVAADVSTWAGNTFAVESAPNAFGRLDTFIGNAAIFDHGTRLKAIAGDQIGPAAAELLGVNLVGYLLGVRAAMEALRR